MDLRSQPWPTLYQAAELAVQQEHWLAAEPLLRQLLQQQPEHGAAHHLLGKVHSAQGQLEEALAAQQRSCALDPGLGWNWFAAGELLLEQERAAKRRRPLSRRWRPCRLRAGCAIN